MLGQSKSLYERIVMSNLIQCECLAWFKKSEDDGKTLAHPYIGAVHNCWNIYGEILAKEFSDPEYFAIHRITVDSYAAQHIGDQNDRRARQSANLHLIALYLYFEKKLPIPEILNFLKKSTEYKKDWPAVQHLTQAKWLTVQDVIKANNAQEHIEVVTQWGESVWKSYHTQHAVIINLYHQFCNTDF